MTTSEGRLETLRKQVEQLRQEYLAALEDARKAHERCRVCHGAFTEAEQAYYAANQGIELGKTVIEVSRRSGSKSVAIPCVVTRLNADGPYEGLVVKKDGTLGVQRLYLFGRRWTLVGKYEEPASARDPGAGEDDRPADGEVA